MVGGFVCSFPFLCLNAKLLLQSALLSACPRHLKTAGLHGVDGHNHRDLVIGSLITFPLLEKSRLIPNPPRHLICLIIHSRRPY